LKAFVKWLVARLPALKGAMDFLRQLFTSGEFQPHGYCYQWNSGLLWLNVLSDALIALAYFTIPFTLLWFIRKRRDLPFTWMFALFGVFIVACGMTHVMEVWNLWHAQYWLAGVIKALDCGSLDIYGDSLNAVGAASARPAERRRMDSSKRGP
jgi:hypothetical protein